MLCFYIAIAHPPAIPKYNNQVSSSLNLGKKDDCITLKLLQETENNWLSCGVGVPKCTPINSAKYFDIAF